MTCIMAIETSDDNVVLAGDYLGSNGFTKAIFAGSKIFKHSNMMFGYTSTFRFGQIIECLLDDNTLYPPSNKDETYTWLVRNFIPKLKDTLKDEDYNTGGNAIIVVNAQVWEVQPDFSVLRAESGVNAVGSGEYHAISSMLTQIISKHGGKLPTTEEAKEIIKVAYEVVGTCVTSVSTKHNILTFK